MNVYLVYSGRFDDHGLDGVFSTKEKAQEFIDEGNCDVEPRIDSWKVDNPSYEINEPQLPIFYVLYFPKEDIWEARAMAYSDSLPFHKIETPYYGVYATTYQCKNEDEAIDMAKEDIGQFIKDKEIERGLK